jgi:hypothetical protein
VASSVQEGIEQQNSGAKGPIFRPPNTKGVEQILWVRANLGPNFRPIYQKRVEKGPIFFIVWFCIKTVIFTQKLYLPIIDSIFSHHFAL